MVVGEPGSGLRDNMPTLPGEEEAQQSGHNLLTVHGGQQGQGAGRQEQQS